MSKHRILLTTIVVISALASVMLLRRSGAKFDAGETRLREQSNELAVLNTEHERLSNLAAQPKTNGTENELGKLRAKAEMLKKQTNHLDRAQAKTDNSQRPPPASSSSAQHTPEYYEQLRQLAGSRPTEARISVGPSALLLTIKNGLPRAWMICHPIWRNSTPRCPAAISMSLFIRDHPTSLKDCRGAQSRSFVISNPGRVRMGQ